LPAFSAGIGALADAAAAASNDSSANSRTICIADPPESIN
jgi:hypothetical protein